VRCRFHLADEIDPRTVFVEAETSAGPGKAAARLHFQNVAGDRMKPASIDAMGIDLAGIFSASF
jgi:hypothetical protein